MKNSFISLLIFLILFTSCGVGASSYITTKRGYDIYINGSYKGREQVRISRTGLPNKALIQIKKGNRIVGKKEIKRKITTNTVLNAMFLNILLGLISFQYPKRTYIKPKKLMGTSIWSKSKHQNSKEKSNSIWNK